MKRRLADYRFEDALIPPVDSWDSVRSITGFAFTQLGRFGLLLIRIIWPGKRLNPFRYVRRLILLSIATIGFITLQLINAVGLLLDEVLFRRYRKTAIEKPVFVIGAPRSGTTTVHRALATHPAFTTTSAIDCLLTPSITQRKSLQLLSKLDSACGSPMARCLHTPLSHSLERFSSNHPFSLFEPEEDFLFLAPLLQCFLFVLPFPDSQWLWQLSMADRHPQKTSTRLTLRWYRLCVRKHLYCNPQAKRYLSKNPTFSGIAHLLTETFPDCQLVICERDAPTAVRSQFRVLAPLKQSLSGSTEDRVFDRRLLDTLYFYYLNLDQIKSTLPLERVYVQSLWQISSSPNLVFDRLFEWLDHYWEESIASPTKFHASAPPQQRSSNRRCSIDHRANPEVEAAMIHFLRWQSPHEHRV